MEIRWTIKYSFKIKLGSYNFNVCSPCSNIYFLRILSYFLSFILDSPLPVPAKPTIYCSCLCKGKFVRESYIFLSNCTYLLTFSRTDLNFDVYKDFCETIFHFKIMNLFLTVYLSIFSIMHRSYLTSKRLSNRQRLRIVVIPFNWQTFFLLKLAIPKINNGAKSILLIFFIWIQVTMFRFMSTGISGC